MRNRTDAFLAHSHGENTYIAASYGFITTDANIRALKSLRQVTVGSFFRLINGDLAYCLYDAAVRYNFKRLFL